MKAKTTKKQVIKPLDDKTKKAKKERKSDEWLKGDKLKKLKEWCEAGLSDSQIASNMGISRQTLWAWKGESETFDETIAKYKAVADAEVVNSLYERCKGYMYVERKHKLNPTTGKMELVEENEKHQPADLSAITFWLKNRQSEEWKDKVVEDDKPTQTIITFGSKEDEAMFNAYAD